MENHYSKDLNCVDIKTVEINVLNQLLKILETVNFIPLQNRLENIVQFFS